MTHVPYLTDSSPVLKCEDMPHGKEREPRPQGLTIEDVSRTAKEVLLRDGTHQPTLIIDGSQVQLVVPLPNLGDTSEERQARMYFAASDLAQTGGVGVLKQVFFVAEAWMSLAQKGELPTVPPSQDVNRMEMLIVSSLDARKQKADLRLVEMKRDEAGTLRALADYQAEQAESTTVVSPLLEAFVQGFRVGRKQRRH